MAIYKRGKNAWRVEVEDGPRGSRRRLSKVVCGTASEAEEQEFLLKAELRGLRGPDDPGNPTINVIVESYVKKCEMTLRDSNTPKSIARMIEKEFGSSRPSRSVSQMDVLSWLVRLRKTRSKRGTYYSPGTIDQVLKTIMAIYNNAIHNNLIDPAYNPAHRIPKARVPNCRSVEIKDEVFLKILAEMQKFDSKLIWLLARFTGLRKHHLLKLRREQIKDGVVRPQEFDPQESFWTSTKRHGLPPVPPSLRQYIEGIGPLFMVGKKQRRNIQWALEESRKKTGIDYWFHDLRRTYATWLRRLGVSYEERLMCMGHSPHRWGVNYRYQVVTMGDLKKVGKKIDDNPFFQKCMDLVFPGEKMRKAEG